jgi:hypothetical protein
MANLQAQLPENLRLDQVATILDMSAFDVIRLIREKKITAPNYAVIPTSEVGKFLMEFMAWEQEYVETFILERV